MEEKKEGFSYSDSAKNKTAFTILGVEFVIMAVVVVIIFGILNYFLIFPLSIMNPKLFGWLPTSYHQQIDEKKSQNQTKKIDQALDANLYVADTNVKPQVEVISDTTSMKISLNDKNAMEQFANQFGVFGRRYYLESGKYSEVLKKLIIHLTDKQQPSNKYFLLGKIPVSSSSLSFDGNTINLFIFLSDEAFTNKSTSPELFFLQNLMATTFRMSYNPIGGKMNQDKEKELNALLMKIDKEKAKTITITKSTNVK